LAACWQLSEIFYLVRIREIVCCLTVCTNFVERECRDQRGAEDHDVSRYRSHGGPPDGADYRPGRSALRRDQTHRGARATVRQRSPRFFSRINFHSLGLAPESSSTRYTSSLSCTIFTVCSGVRSRSAR